MATENFARSERLAVADLLASLGPDQPTLCAGWQTGDLAAHLVVRDRRPDAAAGAVIKSLAARTDRIRAAALTRPWDTLIAQVRNPPRLTLAGIGPIDRAINTTEFFIHHEDVRRAQPDWTPRRLDQGLGLALASQAKFMARLGLRRFPAKITINMPGYGPPFLVGAGGRELDVSGDPGEMLLLLSGRQQVARVTIVGPDDLVERLRTAKLGI